MRPLLPITFVLLMCLSGCGSEDPKCELGEQAELLLTTVPDPPVVLPNGTDTILVVASGQDDRCQPIAEGTTVKFSLTQQSPDESVGYFPNDGTEIDRAFGQMNATTEIQSRTAGTATLNAFCSDLNLNALPVEIEFRL